MAKPTLVAAVAMSLRATAVLMPTMRPWASTSGPPELPDEMAASVWISPSSAPSLGAEGAVERRDDAERDGGLAVEVEGEPDGDHGIAELDLGRRGERHRNEVVAVDAQQGQVVAGIGGDELGLGRLGLTRQAHPDGGRALDDVGVGQDLAVLADRDARSHRSAGVEVGADRDDRRTDRIGDRGDGQHAVQRASLRRRPAGASSRCRRCSTAADRRHRPRRRSGPRRDRRPVPSRRWPR